MRFFNYRHRFCPKMNEKLKNCCQFIFFRAPPKTGPNRYLSFCGQSGFGSSRKKNIGKTMIGSVVSVGAIRKIALLSEFQDLSWVWQVGCQGNILMISMFPFRIPVCFDVTIEPQISSNIRQNCIKSNRRDNIKYIY